MVNSWMHHMIIKFFTYRAGLGLDRKRWSDPKAIAMTYLKFKNRASPHHYKAVKEAYKPAANWNMPYWGTLRQIWEMDPDKAQNVWKTIFPDAQELEPTPEELKKANEPETIKHNEKLEENERGWGL
jgi:hypothetical protein